MRFGVREIILIAVLLALPLSSYWFVFRPQNREIAQARQEIEHKRSTLDRLRELTAQNADLERANAEVRESIAKIEARLPSDKEVDRIVRQVSSLAVEVGLAPPTLKSEPPQPSGSYMEQPLLMATSGDFHAFYEFLIRLEQLPRITRMPAMIIERAEEQDGHMEAGFTLTIYFEESSEPETS